MVYKTIYKLAQGDEKTFEKELNNLSEAGWITFMGMNTNNTEKGFWFSQLMCKTIPKTE
jgi:hypothetical protein